VSTPIYEYVHFASEIFPPVFPIETGLKTDLRDNVHRKVSHTKFENRFDLQPLKHLQTDEYSVHISPKDKATPLQALRVPGGQGSQILRQSAHEGGKVFNPTHRPPLPQEIFLVLISVGG
jgi:hypothetical protein